ncbi:MAG: RNA polymerase sigma factor, partial [Kiritimatiellales bacterium]|nr:RNA polymerase sigma factor [Kiritimatiellales bacterium]
PSSSGGGVGGGGHLRSIGLERRCLIETFLSPTCVNWYRVKAMSSESPLSDADLAKAHLEGDKQAFSLLVERYGPALVGYASRLTGNKEDGSDIAQETFVRLFEKLPKLDISKPLKSWLFKVCTNLCRNYAKKKKSLLFSQLEKVDENESPSIVELIEDKEPSPSEALLKATTEKIVRKAVFNLPKKYQVVISLFYWENLSYEEISDILKLPINTVRTHIKRAKEQLGSSLSPLV